MPYYRHHVAVEYRRDRQNIATPMLFVIAVVVAVVMVVVIIVAIVVVVAVQATGHEK